VQLVLQKARPSRRIFQPILIPRDIPEILDYFLEICVGLGIGAYAFGIDSSFQPLKSEIIGNGKFKSKKSSK
jgi:hypothetical protein